MWEFLTDHGVQQGLNQMILLGALVAARLMPVVYLVPYLGGQVVPQQVKIGISLALTVLVYPAVWQTGAASALPAGSLEIGALILKELVVGLMLGFVAALAFEALRIAGQLIDGARGQTMATALVPQLKARASVSAQLLFQLGVVIFVLTGGHRLFLSALVKSYVMLPPQSFPAFGTHLQAITLGIMRMTADAITLGVLLAFPVIAAVLLANVLLALINKAAPQINVFFLGMPLKAVLGIVILLAGMQIVLQRFTQDAALGVEHVVQLLELMK